MTQQYQGTKLMIVMLILAVCIIGFYLLTAPDERDTAERVGDAAEQLEDRTPMEKMGDAVK